MPRIAAYENVKAYRRQRSIPGGISGRVEFIVPSVGATSEPYAFLAEDTPRRVHRPHYHSVDQFQVIVSGGGVLGRHDLAIHAVHFARAYTPYGPIVAGDNGLAFLTLRPAHDAGVQYLPETSEKLKSIASRSPWQVTEQPKFGGPDAVASHKFSQIKGEDGLAAFSLSLKPNVTASAPDPSISNGQYLIITKGSLEYSGVEHKAITVVFVRPDEHPFHLIAGDEGLDALVLNFPRHSPLTRIAKPSAIADKTKAFRVWRCQLCSFAYDEAQGMLLEGIAPGTLWEDVPENWTCPDCSTSKSDFQMEVVVS